MKNDIHMTNHIQAPAYVNLVVVYKTEAKENYHVDLFPDNDSMMCMIVTVNGTGQVQLKNKEKILLPTKSIFWGNILEVANLESKSDTWNFNCYWFKSYGINVPSNICVKNSNLDLEKEEQNVNKIIELGKTNVPENIFMANALFQYRLLRYIQAFKLSTSEKTLFFNKVLYYINSNITKKINISNIAKHFNYSEKHLRTIFKQYLNTSPKQYILDRKLEHISYLLRSTSLSIEELSEKYSFSSPSNLILYFKKKYKTTPHKIRTTHKDKGLSK